MELGLVAVTHGYFHFAVGLSFRLRSDFARLCLRPTQVGSTDIRALIASSKVNGWRETGFAFGIKPPVMASAIECFAHHTSTERARPAKDTDIQVSATRLPKAMRPFLPLITQSLAEHVRVGVRIGRAQE